MNLQVSTHAVGSLNQGTTQCYQAFLVSFFSEQTKRQLWKALAQFWTSHNLKILTKNSTRKKKPFSMWFPSSQMLTKQNKLLTVLPINKTQSGCFRASGAPHSSACRPGRENCGDWDPRWQGWSVSSSLPPWNLECGPRRTSTIWNPGHQSLQNPSWCLKCQNSGWRWECWTFW